MSSHTIPITHAPLVTIVKTRSSMNVLLEHITQCWLLRTSFGANQYLKDTSLMSLHPQVLKIIFAKEVTIALKDQQRAKQFFARQAHTVTFQVLESLLIAQCAPQATIVQTKRWTLSLAQSVIIAQLAWNLRPPALSELSEQAKA